MRPFLPNGMSNAGLQEAELLASLCHPCITHVYGVMLGPDGPATVMEFVRGGSLRTCLQQLKAKQGRCPAKLKCAIALKAARGGSIRGCILSQLQYSSSALPVPECSGFTASVVMYGSLSMCMRQTSVECQYCVYLKLPLFVF